jgi:octaprenyl-diphosphate synthase
MLFKGLQDIKAPIASELEAFEKHFRDSVRSRVALLDKIMHYIVHRKGKQMRPIFVLLSSNDRRTSIARWARRPQR